jgi:hypothetical protein
MLGIRSDDSKPNVLFWTKLKYFIFQLFSILWIRMVFISKVGVCIDDWLLWVDLVHFYEHINCSYMPSAQNYTLSRV